MIQNRLQFEQIGLATEKPDILTGLLLNNSGTITGDSIMKYIPLTQGKFAIVDDEAFESLSKHKWHAFWNKCTKSFYAARAGKRKNGKQKAVWMHREILGLTSDDKRQSDHIDHNTLDNRKVNLRIVTRSQNQWNKKNVKGYHWNKKRKKYMAQIGVYGKLLYLGYFCTASEAHNAYLQAKKQYHKY